MKVLLCLCFSLVALISAAQHERLFKLTNPNITPDTIYQRVRYDLEFLNLSVGDTVADIGSYDGYYPAMYSVFSDSVVFFLEDISFYSFEGFDTLKTLCEKAAAKKFTNVFYFCIGTGSNTNLPSKKFNKVLIRDAFHHFEEKEAMLLEIIRVMKPKARLILFEPLVPETGANHSLCAGAMYKTQLFDLLLQNGFIPSEVSKAKMTIGGLNSNGNKDLCPGHSFQSRIFGLTATVQYFKRISI